MSDIPLHPLPNEMTACDVFAVGLLSKENRRGGVCADMAEDMGGGDEFQDVGKSRTSSHKSGLQLKA